MVGEERYLGRKEIVMVTIVICYQSGTELMLLANLKSLKRHTISGEYKILVVTRKDTNTDRAFLESLKSCFPVKVIELDISSDITSHVHGMMLDTVIPSMIDTEYVLTLDSDCFPVADGWLSDLEGMMKAGAKVVGILHPWAPPSSDMDRKRIEWRVRSQHCWETTHVACQMLKVSDLIELGMKYKAGDDTGLAIVAAAKKKGWKIDGFKVSRCPVPKLRKIDPEFNRYVCLIFGDKMYHHGGFTRVTTSGDEPVLKGEFEWVGTEIIIQEGAEFLLSDMGSYKFKFDREEEVAQEKMQRLFGLKSQGI